ncbi:unnamed protein product [Trichobilharzia regenti]|nr:unnamed protein product [Trichobilharzia regenti]
MRSRTAAYHFQVNGMVKRLHRHLKAGLSAANNAHWTELLPLVLLYIRNSSKTGAGFTAAELAYNATLRLPGEFASPSSSQSAADHVTQVSRPTNAIRSFKPTSLQPQSTEAFVHLCLQISLHVFVRRGSVSRPLQPPYNLRYEVFKGTDKFFFLNRRGRGDFVGIPRLKPAYSECNPVSLEPSITDNKQVLEEIASTAEATELSIEPSKKTLSG